MAQTQRPKEAAGGRFESESEEAGERQHKAADALRTVAANGKNPPVFAGGSLRDGLLFTKSDKRDSISWRQYHGENTAVCAGEEKPMGTSGCAAVPSCIRYAARRCSVVAVRLLRLQETVCGIEKIRSTFSKGGEKKEFRL